MLSNGPLKLGLIMFLFIFFLFICFPTFFTDNVAFVRFWQSSNSFNFSPRQSEMGKKSMTIFLTRMLHSAIKINNDQIL